MKKFACMLLALVLVLCATVALADTITVGIVNTPPSESGYRQANVEDFEKVFSAENGYEAKTFYSLKNDEQMAARKGEGGWGIVLLTISGAAPSMGQPFAFFRTPLFTIWNLCYNEPGFWEPN